MATKVGTTVAYFESLLTIKSFYILIMRLRKVTWQSKIIIYSQTECLGLQIWQNDNSTWFVPTYKVITTISIATKPARMVIYLDRLLIIKSYKVLIMWSCKVTWQTKTIKSLLQECLWQPNFDHMALWGTRFTYSRRFSTQTLKSSPTSCCVCV